ncbi:MAG: sulfatase-like hydrolase/transferase [Phycisphaerae bacterium]|nr:sulfatase-like hydrolase/transferase [Phycisphaerae bacterium]
MKRMLAVFLLAAALPGTVTVGRPPNIVILYADDLGIGDVGCYGCRDIKTPNIDALARSGIRFTNYYSAAPLCAPSRAAMLTGRAPARTGLSLSANIPSAMGEAGMRTEEITIAELARSRGYATAALGKWHLGSTPETQPNGQGFDLFVGHHASCIDSYSHMYYASEPYYHDLYRNRTEIRRDGVHLVDLITDEAIQFLDAHAEKPFLLYVAYNVPHYPMVAPGRFFEQYADLPASRRDWAALTNHMDESIGRITAHLDTLGLTRDTIVFFSSDNGAPNASRRGEGGGSNGPFREYKRSLFEGGIRMPAVIRWPAKLPAGQVREQLAVATDLFPTIADAISAAPPDDRTYDGETWLPWLRDGAAPGHDVLFFEWNDQHAVRRGKWKVVRNGFINQNINRQNRATGEDAVFLADLEADPGERTNLRRQHPDVAERLLKLHDAWRTSIAEELAASRPQHTETKR